MKKIDKNKIKTWFVTGASSGVGHELCKQLLERGYNVIAVARRVPDFEHENALCLSVDVTAPQTIQEAILKGIDKFGKIDVLSNNAGISANITCEEENLEHMKEVMEVNFFGTFNTINALLPHFRANKNGTIVCNTSQSGLTPRLYGSAYCSSKYAIEALTSVVWIEAQYFCRVMTVELGWFSGTGISKFYTPCQTQYDEYKKAKSPVYYYSDFKNDLNLAIKYIIDEIEKEKIQRRLILGKDAIIKVDSEIKYLRKNWRESKRRALKCAKFNKEFPKKVLKKVMKVVFNKEINI